MGCIGALIISTGREVPLVWHMHPEPSRDRLEGRHVAVAPLVPGLQLGRLGRQLRVDE